MAPVFFGSSAALDADRDQEIVRRTAELLAANLPMTRFFERMCSLIRRFIDARTVLLAIHTDEGTFVEQAAHGDHFGKPEPALVPEDCLIGKAARDGQSRRLSGPASPTDLPPFPIPGVDDPNRPASALIVPLKFGRAIVGVLCVLCPEPARYGEKDLSLMETCGLYLAVQIQELRLTSEKTKFEALAMTDVLTGLANRRYFDYRLGEEWSRCARSGEPLSLILVDVDFFKAFNDRYGHVAGDACLQQVAGALAQCTLRPSDVLARYGGEEFAVILGETDHAGAVAVAERMRAAVSGLDVNHGASGLNVVTISAGVATCTTAAGTDRISLVRRADEALYEAKKGGRNRVVGENYESDAAPVRARVTTSDNLPSQVTSFLGREEEVEQVKHLLDSTRLVTLAGPGGVGKTRIALHVAQESRAFYQDGVCYVDLGPLADSHLIAPTI
ncbi:MAG TPA: diguanylate cyclase, partial [Candidatus Eremiobacteraceae bacterium]|nr:diguanylate cyclase [Candidatus Eremiobacteraceae bacterium]